MILLELFVTFFYIGITTFGGGYAMIPLVREQVIAYGWLTEAEFLNIIAVAESTPGPVAVNTATFVGSEQAGILGSALATLGVVLPSFIIILIISALIRNFLKYKGVTAFLDGVRPVVVGLIVATAVTMLFGNLFGLSHFGDSLSVDVAGVIIFAILLLIAFLWKKIKKKKLSPVIMILISAALGIVIYPMF